LGSFVDFHDGLFFFFQNMVFPPCLGMGRRVKGQTSKGRGGWGEESGFGSQSISIDLRGYGGFRGRWRGKKGLG
jgi:hypothetical protein